MGALLYYLLTLTEAGLGVVGIRATYEEPRYATVERLPGGVEVRDYAARLAVETDSEGDGSAPFGRLFRYITGANSGAAKVAMTVPVAQSGERAGERLAMTVPVQNGDGVMRFFLPASVAEHGAPVPSDPKVRLVSIPPERMAVLRFSGVADRAAASAQQALLLQALAKAGLHPAGSPILLTYDPPFAIPFLRRNEVAVTLPPAAG